MTDLLLVLLQRVSLWLALAALASLLAALVHPLFHRAVARCAPSLRSLLRLAYALVPPLAAAATVALLLWPEASGWFVPEHCHGMACESHAPVTTPDSPAAVLFAVAGGVAAVATALLALAGLRVARRRIRLLSRLARSAEPRGWRLLETDAPVAWCSGLFRPQVLISRGLVDCLAPSELQVVIAHERAHADRLDNLLLVLAAIATLAWPRAPRRRLLASLAQDCEQACDAIAAAGYGRRHVATLVRKVAALTPEDPAPGRAVAFRARGATERAAALEAPALRASPLPGGLFVAAACFLFVAGVVGPAHAFLEWLGVAL